MSVFVYNKEVMHLRQKQQLYKKNLKKKKKTEQNFDQHIYKLVVMTSQYGQQYVVSSFPNILIP